LGAFTWTYAAGALALLACYVVATCVNDVFDVEVDRVNHPAAKDRPLVTGAATRSQLVMVAACAAVAALALGVAIGPLGVGVVAVSLLVNVVYSVPPLRLCARPVVAAPVLAFAYVALPYGLGLAAAGLGPGLLDIRVVATLMLLFTGRMLLKDFRDRRGDAAFGKRTFLLTYGKAATLLAVLGCVVAGDAFLASVLPQSFLLMVVVQSYFVAIALELRRLWRASAVDRELAAIARGARMGNAVILTWLGYTLLRASGAGPAELAALVIALGAMFWLAYLLPAPAAAPATTPA